MRLSASAVAAASLLACYAAVPTLAHYVRGMVQPSLLEVATTFAERSTTAATRAAGALLLQQLNGDPPSETPQQLRLSLTDDPSTLQISWVTLASPCINSNAHAVWWPTADPSAPLVSQPAALTTYTAGLFGWSGKIYTTFMTGLVAGTSYTYAVGCGTVANSTSPYWSGSRSFRAPLPVGPNANLSVAVLADQGTIVPLGWAVADRVIADHQASPFDLTVLAGDISYATLEPPNNEVEWTWDAYGIQQDPLYSTAPAMMVPGNHENVPGNYSDASGVTTPIDFAAYVARYSLALAPAGSNTLYFSFNAGPVHFIALCSEIGYGNGSAQYAWLAGDLAAVDRAVTPWVIAMLHRPIYSADADEYPSHSPGGPLSVALEPIFMAYGVDLVIQGHMHEGERTHAVFNGTVATLPTAGNIYVNPRAPIYVLQGTSGALQEETFLDPLPAWSAFALNGVYGYGRMHIQGGGSLSYQFVATNGTVIDAWGILKGAAAEVAAATAEVDA